MKYGISFELERDRVKSIAVFDRKKPVEYTYELDNNTRLTKQKP